MFTKKSVGFAISPLPVRQPTTDISLRPNCNSIFLDIFYFGSSKIISNLP